MGEREHDARAGGGPALGMACWEPDRGRWRRALFQHVEQILDRSATLLQRGTANNDSMIVVVVVLHTTPRPLPALHDRLPDHPLQVRKLPHPKQRAPAHSFGFHFRQRKRHQIPQPVERLLVEVKRVLPGMDGGTVRDPEDRLEAHPLVPDELLRGFRGLRDVAQGSDVLLPEPAFAVLGDQDGGARGETWDRNNQIPISSNKRPLSNQ